MTVQLMTDIETLSSDTDGAIIAIGLVAFNQNEILDKMEILIDPQLAIGHRDPKTIKWWSEQDHDVRVKMFSGVQTPWSACSMFVEFCSLYSKHLQGFWANPPQFDIIILRHLFDVCAEQFPIHFRKERDFRTLKTLAHALHIDYQSAYAGINKHDAVEDAVAQATAVQIINKALGVK